MGGKIHPKTPKYMPPYVGRLKFSVVDGFARKEIYRTLTNSEKQFIDAVAKSTNDASGMTGYGVAGAKLRVEEAIDLFREMNNDSRNKANILSKILPQLAHVADARILVQKALGGDRLELMKLRQALGAVLRPLLGMCSGYYMLDLSQPLDRLCLLRLMEISTTRSDQLRSACLVPGTKYGADFSQKHNDNSCFRNEVYNDESCVINAKFAQPLPKAGTLSFDFSTRLCPNKDDMIATDQRVVKSLHSLFLLPSSLVIESMQQLERLAKLADKSKKGTGCTIYECSWPRALDISAAKRAFYDNNLERIESFLEWVHEHEEISFVFDSPAAVEAARDVSHDAVCRSVCGDYMDPLADPASFEENKGTIWALEAAKLLERAEQTERAKKTALLAAKRAAQIQAHGGGVISDEWHAVIHEDCEEDGRRSPELLLENRGAPKLEVVQDEFTKKMHVLLLSPGISNEAKAARMVDAIDGVFSKQWIMCRHLALICQCFAQLGRISRTKIFGSYRSEIVVLLFERLVDVQNFELVLRELEPVEIATVTARIGWLNFYNPMKPEGTVETNLAIYEERVIAKMLNTLGELVCFSSLLCPISN